MRKFVVLRGLPGSGKSTEAKRLVASGGYVRINRDTIREMLLCPNDDGSKVFNYKIENLVTQISLESANKIMCDGKFNIVLDECNLNPKHLANWKNYVEKMGYSFEIRDMKVSIAECINRDANRTPNVGARVIKNMALRNGMLDGYDVLPKTPFVHGDRKIVLCDVDGTLADISHRTHFVNGDAKKDWKSFFEIMSLDGLRESTYKILQKYIEGYIIVLVTARPQEYLIDTVEWLDKYKVPFDYMIMRKDGDYRRDDIVKQEILDKWFPDKSVIEVVIDDRPQVIRMWEKNGLNVINVGNGIEF